MGVLIFLLIVAAGLFTGYQWLKEQSYVKRLTIKIFLVNVSLIMAGLGVILLISCVVGIYTTTNENSLAYRQMEVEEHLAEGDYYFADMTLRLADDYEAKFDYAWERVVMYYAYDSYLLYSKALQNRELPEEKISLYKQRMKEYADSLRAICANSQLEENRVYKEFYLRKLSEHNAE